MCFIRHSVGGSNVVGVCMCLLPWLSDDSDGNISEGDGVEG